MPPPRLWLAPLLAGAVACADDDASDGVPPELAALEAVANTIEAEWLMTRVATLADDAMEGRDNNSEGGRRARAWLEAQLREIGLEPMLQEFTGGTNVTATLPGSDPALASEYVIVSAHYDHLGLAERISSQCVSEDPDDGVCNGAADNAAGCAAVLGIARALVQAPVAPKRSVLFIFWDAEEDGLVGSRYFTEQAPLVPLDAVVAMYSVDNVGSEIFPGVSASFALGVEHSEGLRERVRTSNLWPDFVTYPVSLRFSGSPDGSRSDHHSFRLAGVPVIFFGSGSSAAYHTVADELGLVNAEKLLAITRHVLLMTARVADAAERPRFVTEAQPHLDDAIALLALSEQVLANPSALGLEGILIAVVEGWAEDLRAWVERPPASEVEWREYDALIDTILDTVFTFTGR